MINGSIDDDVSTSVPDTTQFSAQVSAEQPQVRGCSTEQAEDSSSSEQDQEIVLFEQPRIGGFDPGGKPFFREPSLYLSILAVFAATSVTLNKTPLIFWIVFLSISALAVVLHIIAERALFANKDEHAQLSAPGEGIFVLAFGSILPGLSLIAYSVSSVQSSFQSISLEGFGKLALLLVVPIFNYLVWASLKKRFLSRPRLIGLMNGLALGLSASWTLIWLKCFLLTQSPVYCKFGWMFLLFLSPFLLWAAGSLCVDLWRKTEPRIGRIAGTFSILGVLLSLLFVFGPLLHALFVQSLLRDARQGSVSEKLTGLSLLRSTVTDEDLRPSEYPVNGPGLAALLIADRGLDCNSEEDRNLYFRLTGRPFDSSVVDSVRDSEVQVDQFVATSNVGSKREGLSLTRSQISGNIDQSSLSSSMDWFLTFRNTSEVQQEARAEIALPAGAVVSGVTLWIDGNAHEAVFAPTAKANEAYQTTANRGRDPLLVTVSGIDRIFIQCWPVPPNGAEMKIRVGLKAPINTKSFERNSLHLPQLLGSNFVQPKRHLVHFNSRDRFSIDNIGSASANGAEGFVLDGIIKNSKANESLGNITALHNIPLQSLAFKDRFAKNDQFISESFRETDSFVAKQIVILLDSSDILKDSCAEVRNALATIPAGLNAVVYFIPETSKEKRDQGQFKPMSIKDALSKITPASFVGGQDNTKVLRDVMETASERTSSAVLWIHGPQPVATKAAEANAPELINKLHLYDFEIVHGPNLALQSLKLERLGTSIKYSLVKRHSSVGNDLKELLADMKRHGKVQNAFRSSSKNLPKETLITNPLVCAQLTCLWANEEVSRLLACGQKEEAQAIGARYHIVTPVTGALVLEPSAAQSTSSRNATDKKNQNKDMIKLAARKYFESLMALAEMQRSASDFVSAEKTVRIAMSLCTSLAPKLDSDASPDASDSTSHIDASVFFPGDDFPGFIEASGGSQSHPLLFAAPKYGQSNEVGQLADYGYDTARDLVRLLCSLSLMLAIPVGILLLRTRKGKSHAKYAIAKVIALVIAVPVSIHLIGTFLINNFGGLGGGL